MNTYLTYTGVTAIENCLWYFLGLKIITSPPFKNYGMGGNFNFYFDVKTTELKKWTCNICALNLNYQHKHEHCCF